MLEFDQQSGILTALRFAQQEELRRAGGPREVVFAELAKQVNARVDFFLDVSGIGGAIFQEVTLPEGEVTARDALNSAKVDWPTKFALFPRAYFEERTELAALYLRMNSASPQMREETQAEIRASMRKLERKWNVAAGALDPRWSRMKIDDAAMKAAAQALDVSIDVAKYPEIVKGIVDSSHVREQEVEDNRVRIGGRRFID